MLIIKRKSRCKVCSFFYIYNEKCENSIKFLNVKVKKNGFTFSGESATIVAQ